jgi:D-arginine dehydrogenase
METFDFIIVGAGIAGASAAYELVEGRRVLLLEGESQPGYHTTGRSVATYIQILGNEVIRPLTIASKPFLGDPPAGFAERPILSPRGCLFVNRPGHDESLDQMFEEGRRRVPDLRRLDGEETWALVPVLRVEEVGGGLLEPGAMDADVNALHQGFLRGAKSRGARLVTDAEVTGLERGPEGWRVESRAGAFAAPVVINAAGAWSDVVAGLAGAAPVGLVPKRRTVIAFTTGHEIDAWPIVGDLDAGWYFKPDAGRILASPADETPMPPCDVQPEELDVAITVERMQTATELEIPRIDSKWAGLRSFVDDEVPVVGFDPKVEGFFWLAGQGGYGIQTSPAMARTAAALATGAPLPADLADAGVTAEALSPARFAKSGTD